MIGPRNIRRIGCVLLSIVVTVALMQAPAGLAAEPPNPVTVQQVINALSKAETEEPFDPDAVQPIVVSVNESGQFKINHDVYDERNPLRDGYGRTGAV